MKLTKNVRIGFNKRFANGEQDVRLVCNGKEADILKDEKQYAWQHDATYNHILPLIEYAQNQAVLLTDNDLYGKNGLVERLIPYQRLYNDTMNQQSDRLAYATRGIFFVEDGSVYADDLAQEGVAPGSIVVFRQGAVEPWMVFDKTVGTAYRGVLDDCLAQMWKITDCFIATRK